MPSAEQIKQCEDAEEAGAATKIEEEAKIPGENKGN